MMKIPDVFNISKFQTIVSDILVLSISQIARTSSVEEIE